MSVPAVQLEGVTFDYPRGPRALDDIDLVIETGERVVIVGQNGSGKSTLVRHLNGLLRPVAGSVAINGRPVGRRHVADLAREVGLAFQNPDRQIFAGSVRAEVAFGPRNLGLGKAELDAAVARAIAIVGLVGDEQTNPYDLGFSRRKLLALASILAMETPIAIVDEPTTGQDARGVKRIQTIVAELSAAGRTVIGVSHDMRFVAESFDRVIVMRAGRIVLDGTPEKAFGEDSWPILASTYLEPPLAARVGDRLGLGATPTEAALIDALRRRG